MNYLKSYKIFEIKKISVHEYDDKKFIDNEVNFSDNDISIIEEFCDENGWEYYFQNRSDSQSSPLPPCSVCLKFSRYISYSPAFPKKSTKTREKRSYDISLERISDDYYIVELNEVNTSYLRYLILDQEYDLLEFFKKLADFTKKKSISFKTYFDE